LLPIGVLGLQGDFREHIATLDALGIPSKLVKKPEHLKEISGLIIPGGESTVIDKLSKIFELREPIIILIQEGLPVFGTCAGLILLANKLVDGTATQETFGGLDITVQRNAFGSQVDSFESELQFDGLTVNAAFIRAPIVTAVGSQVQILASLNDGRVVAVRQKNLLGISFHPEVTGETKVHEYFVEMCKTANFQATN
jgi:5'-phosphate synthase pdxT subunit